MEEDGDPLSYLPRGQLQKEPQCRGVPPLSSPRSPALSAQAYERELPPRVLINSAGYKVLTSVEQYLELVSSSLPGEWGLLGGPKVPAPLRTPWGQLGRGWDGVGGLQGGRTAPWSPRVGCGVKCAALPPGRQRAGGRGSGGAQGSRVPLLHLQQLWGVPHPDPSQPKHPYVGALRHKAPSPGAVLGLGDLRKSLDTSPAGNVLRVCRRLLS